MNSNPIFILLLSISSFFELKSQTAIKSVESLIIPNAKVVSQVDPGFLIYSDSKGIIDRTAFTRLPENSIVRIKHISFIDTALTVQELLKSNEIIVRHKQFILPEFSIISDAEKKKYVVLSGYARSYQVNDLTNAYYFDAHCSLLFKRGKDSPRFRYEDYRFMRNDSLIENNEPRKFSIEFRAVAIPALKIEYLPSSSLFSSSVPASDSINTETKKYVALDGSINGTIHLNESICLVTIDDKDVIGERKALGTSVKTKYSRVQMAFVLSEGEDFETINSFEKLIYIKETKGFEVLHEDDSKSTFVDVENEFFVEDISLSDKPDNYSDFVRSPLRIRSNYREGQEFGSANQFYEALDRNVLKGLNEVHE